MEFINLTPFAADRLIVMDGMGCEMLLVLVKATFSLDSGVPKLSEKQDAIVMADEYAGEPGGSSLRHAAETSLFKPAADVVVSGFAHTHRSRRTEALVVLEIGSLIQKAVLVRGDRVWEGLLGSRISSPQGFLALPLVYERAFGGTDTTTQPPESWPDNPVGIGFRARKSKAPLSGTRLPNLEDARRPITHPKDRPPSSCLGPVAPSWNPRPNYAGTYDAAWQRDRMPFPPADFNPRFEHPVPVDQVLHGYFSGGEPIRLTNVRPEGGGYRFALPSIHPEVVVRVGGERQTPPVRCDTLAIDCEGQRLSLLCRAALKVHGRVAELEWIKVQERAFA
jgi:hypothetical protein